MPAWGAVVLQYAPAILAELEGWAKRKERQREVLTKNADEAEQAGDTMRAEQLRTGAMLLSERIDMIRERLSSLRERAERQ
jgi:hypothetical protein